MGSYAIKAAVETMSRGYAKMLLLISLKRVPQHNLWYQLEIAFVPHTQMCYSHKCHGMQRLLYRALTFKQIHVLCGMGYILYP